MPTYTKECAKNFLKKNHVINEIRLSEPKSDSKSDSKSDLKSDSKADSKADLKSD